MKTETKEEMWNLNFPKETALPENRSGKKLLRKREVVACLSRISWTPPIR